MTKAKRQNQGEPLQEDVNVQEELAREVAELTADLRRNRADFENYRKRVEQEKQMSRMSGEATAVLKLLPVVDNIERAIAHIPADLTENKWAQGIAGLAKNLEKSLDGMDLKRIDAKPGTTFDPELHEAIQVDEDAEGELEVIAEELQAGYTLHGQPIRHSLVNITRK